MKKTIRIAQLGVTFFSRIMNNLFLSPKIQGIENLDKLAQMKSESIGLVVIANHVNANDPFVIVSMFPEELKGKVFPMTFLASHEKFTGPIKNFIMKLLGCIPVGNGQNIRETIRLLKNGEAVFLFPEGEVSLTGELGEDRGLMETISKFSRVIVQPIRIGGLKCVEDDIWDIGNMLARHRKVEVIFGEPFILEKASKINAVEEIAKLKIEK